MAEEYTRRLETQLSENPDDEELQQAYLRAMRREGRTHILNEYTSHRIELLPSEHERLLLLCGQYADNLNEFHRHDFVAKNGTIREFKKYFTKTKDRTLTIQNFPNLESVTLHGCRLREITLTPYLRSLRVLDLENNNLGTLGIKNLKTPNSLQILKLDANNLGRTGAFSLDLPTSLQELHIRHNGLEPSDIQELKQRHPTVDIYG
jgi:hypothetical protein